MESVISVILGIILAYLGYKVTEWTRSSRITLLGIVIIFIGLILVGLSLINIIGMSGGMFP